MPNRQSPDWRVSVKKVLGALPFIGPRVRHYDHVKRTLAVYERSRVRPDHFYSPIPDFDYVEREAERIFPEPPALLDDVEFNLDGQ